MCRSASPRKPDHGDVVSRRARSTCRRCASGVLDGRASSRRYPHVAAAKPPRARSTRRSITTVVPASLGRTSTVSISERIRVKPETTIDGAFAVLPLAAVAHLDPQPPRVVERRPQLERLSRRAAVRARPRSRTPPRRRGRCLPRRPRRRSPPTSQARSASRASRRARPAVAGTTRSRSATTTPWRTEARARRCRRVARSSPIRASISASTSSSGSSSLRRGRSGEELEALVQWPATPLDQPVRVEHDRRALLELGVARLEAQRRVDADRQRSPPVQERRSCRPARGRAAADGRRRRTARPRPRGSTTRYASVANGDLHHAVDELARAARRPRTDRCARRRTRGARSAAAPSSPPPARPCRRRPRSTRPMRPSSELDRVVPVAAHVDADRPRAGIAPRARLPCMAGSRSGSTLRCSVSAMPRSVS